MRTAKTLIKLGGSTGWSESSVGPHAIFFGFVKTRLIWYKLAPNQISDQLFLLLWMIWEFKVKDNSISAISGQWRASVKCCTGLWWLDQGTTVNWFLSLLLIFAFYPWHTFFLDSFLAECSYHGHLFLWNFPLWEDISWVKMKWFTRTVLYTYLSRPCSLWQTCWWPWAVVVV